MRRFYSTVCLSFLMVLLVSCMEDPTIAGNFPSGLTVRILDTTRVSVTVEGSIVTIPSFTTYGFEISEDNFYSDPLFTKEYHSSTPGYFVWRKDNLSKGATYFIRAFVTNGLSINYSAVLKIVMPLESKAILSDIRVENEFLVADLLDDGGRSIVESGFICEQEKDLEELKRGEKHIGQRTPDGRIILPIHKLDSDKKYNCIAYAIDDSGQVGYSYQMVQIDISGDDTPEIPFVDSAFKNFIYSTYDTNQDGSLSFREIEAVTRMTVKTDSISSLAGIEIFKNLEELTCDGYTWVDKVGYPNGKLYDIDISRNAKLSSFTCNGNRLLTEIDISNNIALVSFRCHACQLTSLDVSKNSSLQSLECFSNQLTSLDVSGNTSLQRLNCCYNQMNNLDVSKNKALWDLNCDGNQLTSLDVSGNTSLRSLSCSNNQLTSLDVSGNTSLQSLSCSNNQLTSLDVSKNTALQWLNCDGNQLTSFDISNNTYLKYLYCSNPNLKRIKVWRGFSPNSLTDCNIGNASFSIDSDDTTEIQISDQNFRDFILRSFDGNGDGKLSQTEASFVVSMEVNTDDILSINEIEFFPNLKTLICQGSSRSGSGGSGKLKSLDVSKNTLLQSLSCSYNQLNYLDVSKNTLLQSLHCDNNELTSLDVSKNTALRDLYCGGNQLTNLDVSGNTLLQNLSCGGNQLMSLDVSNNTALRYLYCDDNQLTNLDVSGNTLLQNLSCGGNQLTSLDVSKNILLQSLYCSNNQLTSLDVSNNTSLTYLFCLANRLLIEIWLRTGQIIENFKYDNIATIKYKE